MAEKIKILPTNPLGSDFIAIREQLNHDIANAFYGGWPPGYQPGKGMPGTLKIEDIFPSRCDKIIGQVTS